MSRILGRLHQALDPPVQRGRLVKESARFTVREIRRATSSHVYEIRESGLRVQLEHGTSDVLTFDQAYIQHVYEPPTPALAALRALSRPLRALDLGANVGMWGLWFHGRFPGAQVTALEPDPDNVAKHRRQIALNRLGDSWRILEAAATCADGQVPFTVGHTTTGRIGEQGEPDAVPVTGMDVFSLLTDVDLLKIDIEGAEWKILSDLRMADLRVPVVMLEHHPYGAPSSNPAEVANRRLQDAGYTTASLHGEPNGTGMVWGWRPR